MTITIAEITVAAEDFELGQLVVDRPDRYVELERVVPLEQTALPFIWVSANSRDAIEAALADHPEIRSVTPLVDDDDRSLYSLEWSGAIDGFVGVLVETGGTILEGSGSAEQWEFRIRFPDHLSFSEFSRRCTEDGIDVTLRSVSSPGVAQQETHRLTPSQRETLLAAHELGFFEIPRAVTLSDLAAQFDISEQAVSQRLRRGTGNLIVESLLDTAE